VQTTRPRWALALAIFAGLFGLLTVKAGGEVLFFDGPGRQAAGDYVLFVLVFNFLAGFAYVAGAVGLVLWRPWALPLAITITLSTALIFAALGLWILSGNPYEVRTVAAMTLRTSVWLGISFALRGKF